MKAWGLIFSIIALCQACSTPPTAAPVIDSPIEPYVGPELSAPIDFDRADAGVVRKLPVAG